MSRSALERQAMRSARSGTLPVPTSAPAGFLSEVDDQLTEEQMQEEEMRSNVLPIHGNDRTFNLNTLLAQTILASEYFKGLVSLTTYLEVIDEIYSYCDHVAPWAPGTSRVPSSAFCLLMKLFVMKLTRQQMNEILVHEDSPFIRAIGFLYLRYTCPPKELWAWFEPFMDDEEEFKPSPTEGTMTMGQWVRKIISDMQYYGTMLPRIPVPIERKMKVQLLLHEEMKKREKANFRIVNLLKPGTKVRAIYADDDNDPSWYDAVINSVEENNRYWVTFPEYGNQELVRLGSIMLQAKTDKSPPRRSGGGGSGSGSGGGESGEHHKKTNGSGGGGGGSDRKRSRSDSRSRSKARGGSRDRDNRERGRDDRDGDSRRGRDRGGRGGSRDRDRGKDKGSRRSRSRSRDGKHRRTSRDRDRGSGRSRDGRDGGRRDSRDRGGGGRGRSRSDSRDRHSRRDRDRDSRRDGGSGTNGGGAKPAPSAEEDMSSSILDMDTSKLYAQVMKREREASQAVGKDYAARPASYKGSLSLKLDRYTQRRKSRSRSPERHRGSGGARGGGGGERRAEPSPPRRKAAPVVTAEELRRQQELKKRYGDASSSKR